MLCICRGQNNEGELMLGSTGDKHVPTRNAAFDAHGGVVDVACGNEMTAVLCSNGTLHTAGLNKTGQCAREVSSDAKAWPKRHVTPGTVTIPGSRPLAKLVWLLLACVFCFVLIRTVCACCG